MSGRRRTARHTRALGAARRQESAVVALGSTAAQRSQRASSPQRQQASSRARPLRFSTHTTRAVAAQRRDQRVGVQAGPRRVLAAAVDDVDHRPAVPLGLRDGAEQRPHASASSEGTGDTTHARHTGPPGPLDGDVAGVPRGRLLLLVGLVVLVEHHHGGQVGAPAPTPPPGPRRRWPRPRAAAQSFGMRATGRPPGAGGPPAAGPPPPTARAPARCRGAAAARATAERVGGGRQPQHGAVGWSNALGRAARRAARAPGPARRAGRRAAPDRRRRRRRAAGTWPAGPAQRHAAHSARSTTSAGGPQPVTLAIGRSVHARRAARRRSATTQPPTRRPCRSTRTMVPTRTWSRRALRDQVVERLVDGRDVGRRRGRSAWTDRHRPSAGLQSSTLSSCSQVKLWAARGRSGRRPRSCGRSAGAGRGRG